MRVYLVLLILMFATGNLVLAHGGKKHKKQPVAVQSDSAKKEQAEHIQGDTVHHHAEGMKPDESKVTADLQDFPSLHPLIVHFAIVLIIVAAALQLLNAVMLRSELAWIIAVILAMGFLAAWFAARNFHPHTHGLTEHAKKVLEQHEKFADWTINTAMAAFALQVVYLAMLKFSRAMKPVTAAGTSGPASRLNRLSAIAIAIVLLSSAYVVSRAGHYGAQLVHIEGIGPQGKFLEMHH